MAINNTGLRSSSFFSELQSLRNTPTPQNTAVTAAAEATPQNNSAEVRSQALASRAKTQQLRASQASVTDKVGKTQQVQKQAQSLGGAKVAGNSQQLNQKLTGPDTPPFIKSMVNTGSMVDELQAARAKLKKVSQHQVLNLGAQSSGTTTKESSLSRKLGSEVGGVSFDKDIFPASGGTLDIVGHSDGTSIEGQNPKQLAAFLKSALPEGTQLKQLNLVSCHSEQFMADLKTELEHAGVSVETISGARGRVAVDRATGQMLDEAQVGDLEQVKGHDGGLGGLTKDQKEAIQKTLLAKGFNQSDISYVKENFGKIGHKKPPTEKLKEAFAIADKLIEDSTSPDKLEDKTKNIFNVNYVLPQLIPGFERMSGPEQKAASEVDGKYEKGKQLVESIENNLLADKDPLDGLGLDPDNKKTQLLISEICTHQKKAIPEPFKGKIQARIAQEKQLKIAEISKAILFDLMKYSPNDVAVEDVDASKTILCHEFAFQEQTGKAPTSAEEVIRRAKGKRIAVCFGNHGKVDHTARLTQTDQGDDKEWVQALQNNAYGTVFFRTNFATLTTKSDGNVIIYDPAKPEAFKIAWAQNYKA